MTRDNQQVALSVALEPLDPNSLPYTPALLLDGGFDVSITDDPGFGESCRLGFETFDELNACSSGEPFTLDLLADFFVTNVLTGGDDGHVMDLPRCAGWLLGWFSALALGDWQLARKALNVLKGVVFSRQKQEQEKEVLHG